MTRVYFVRHAQPEHDWKEDRTRPLTEEGKKDSAIVLGFLKEEPDSRRIAEAGIYVVDGKEIMPDIWYDIQGKQEAA